MKSIFKDYLFNKHYLVSEGNEIEENQFETLFTLANKFNIRIDRGEKLIRSTMIRYIAEKLGENIPEPFYRGFPQSVRELSSDQLLFDQLVHYARTYGFGNFSEAGYSLFEENFARIAFRENTEIKVFSVITEEEAETILGEMTDHLLAGTRPLSEEQFALVKEYISEYAHEIKEIASKNTCIRLLTETRNQKFADFLYMSDVIKLVDEINYKEYRNKDMRQLNLRNQDRKFVTTVMNRLFQAGRCDLRNCYEKKKLWNGLLHHIHYKADGDEAKKFTDAMRSAKNESVFSEFEKEMTRKNIRNAVDVLSNGKGSAAVLRNLNYILSRCKRWGEVQYVLDNINTKNAIVLIQLLIRYSHYSQTGARTFRFEKHNKLKVHIETEEEQAARRSVISSRQAEQVCKRLRANLKEVLRNRLGKVYIDPDMANYALPMQEGTSQGGFGTLTRGSRIHIGAGKKIRAFTYWEKVNDIDLSVFGIDEAGARSEFSWRTMAQKQSDAIAYSGDETSGYNGGSEYFDIDTQKIRKMYPNMRYLIFCDNVYSGVTFDRCFCKAGYMLRDTEDSGMVYEPKTVKSSFIINCGSTFAYLFGIDLRTNDLIWLNMARDSRATVAGMTEMDFLPEYFDITNTINVYTFFEMMAEKVVKDMAEAEIVVTDKETECGSGAKIIREYDTEKMIALMNSK